MPGASHFSVFVLVFLIAFIFILNYVLRARTNSFSLFQISLVALIVVVGGMLFAKYGAIAGLTNWLYCGLPTLLALTLPPFAFRMNRTELFTYLIMIALLAPLIHTLFSFFLGWKEVLPFPAVPSLYLRFPSC